MSSAASNLHAVDPLPLRLSVRQQRWNPRELTELDRDSTSWLFTYERAVLVALIYLDTIDIDTHTKHIAGQVAKVSAEVQRHSSRHSYRSASIPECVGLLSEGKSSAEIDEL